MTKSFKNPGELRGVILQNVSSWIIMIKKKPKKMGSAVLRPATLACQTLLLNTAGEFFQSLHALILT